MTKKIIVATGLLTSVLLADFTLEFKMDDNTKQIVQYKDAQHVKITTNGESQGESGAQLIVGDKKYMVMTENGHTRYMDMDVMLGQMKQMGAMFGEAPQQEKMSVPEFKVVNKGKKKKIAGVDAQEWTLEAKADGRKERMKVWVTKDDKIVDAIGKYAETMKIFTQMDPQGEDAFSTLLSIEKGTATVDFEGMKLLKYDDANIPNAVFALPKGMDVGKKPKGVQTTTVKKPPLCPLVGKHGDAKQLKKILKPEADGWKLIENGTCINMMKMRAENAIYQKGDAYIHINLSINVAGENGMIAKYRTSNMKISNLQQGKIQGARYQSALLNRVRQNAMDIKLPNAMLSLTATKNVKDELPLFAKSVFDLSKFVPIKKSKPTADDALKSLGAMFGEKRGAQREKAPSNADMQKAKEMLNGLFGN